MGDQNHQDDSALENPTFPPIGDPDEGQPPVEDGGEPAPDSPEAIAARLERLEADREQEREESRLREQRLQSTIDRLLAGQTSAMPQASHDTPPADISLDGLPNPEEDHEAFSRELSQRVKNYVDSTTRNLQSSLQSETDRNQTFNDLWNRFQRDYPDLAKREALVQGAATLETQRLRGQGIDPIAAIKADPEDFLTRIADRMKKELGSESEKPDSPSQPKNRTKGVSGGSASPQTPSKSGDKSPGFIETLKKTQLDMGII